MKSIIHMRKYIVISCIFALTACANVDMQKANFGGIAGTMVGALAGGHAGAKFGGGLGKAIFIVAGAVTGAGVGYEAGIILYPSDQAAYDNNARVALNKNINGKISDWVNPETGNSGIFTPVKTFVATSGRTCRDYRSTLALKTPGDQKGIIAHQTGTACQQTDGSWHSLTKKIG